EHGRLFLERPDLVVEHPLAPRDGTARVVDARHPFPRREVAHDQPVVADRRAHDREHTLLHERVELLLDVVRGARRQARGQLANQLDGTVERDGFEAERDRRVEAVAAVVLREVEQQPDADRRDRHGSITSNSGSAAASDTCSKRTRTRAPICTSSGSRPTMFVMSRGPSSRSTSATAIGSRWRNDRLGFWRMTVRLYTVPRPLASTHSIVPAWQRVHRARP